MTTNSRFCAAHIHSINLDLTHLKLQLSPTCRTSPESIKFVYFLNANLVTVMKNVLKFDTNVFVFYVLCCIHLTIKDMKLSSNLLHWRSHKKYKFGHKIWWKYSIDQIQWQRFPRIHWFHIFDFIRPSDYIIFDINSLHTFICISYFSTSCIPIL